MKDLIKKVKVKKVTKKVKLPKGFVEPKGQVIKIKKPANINPTVKKLREELQQFRTKYFDVADQLTRVPKSGALTNHINSIKELVTEKISEINTKVAELSTLINENL